MIIFTTILFLKRIEMSDYGLKVLYVYEHPPKAELHEGIDCIKRGYLEEFLDRPGIRYAHWFVEEGISVLSDDEENLLNSRLVYLYGEEYKKRDYLWFFKDFEPLVILREDGLWEIFTLPTQWVRGFNSYRSAVHYAMDYIEEGKWKK